MNENLTPDEIERLLEGVGNTRGPVRPGLDEALRSIRNEFSAAPDPDVRTEHLAAMSAAFGQAPAASASFIAVRRRRFARRVAIGSAASLLLGGSAMAATGTLPDPAQDAVAKVVHSVGINLPHTTPSGASVPTTTPSPKHGKKNSGPAVSPTGSNEPGSAQTGKNERGGHGDGEQPNQTVEPGHTPGPSDDGGSSGNGGHGDQGDHGDHTSGSPGHDGEGGGGPGGSGSGHGADMHTPEPTDTSGH